MKRLLFIVLLIPLAVMSQQPEGLVHNTHLYVDDYAHVFTYQQQQELDKVIRSFFDTAQIEIVTINSFGQISPGDYVVRLGRKWGVGGQSNNGLLIVIGIKDRHIEVATGPGLEGDLPDVLVVQLQREFALPEFKKQRYYEGTLSLLNAYINKLSPAAKSLRTKENDAQNLRSQQQWENTKERLLNILIVLAVITLISLPIYFRRRKNKRIRERLKEEERERERERLLNSRKKAEAFLQNSPTSKDLLVKSYPSKTVDIDKYCSALDTIKNRLASNDLTDFIPFILLASNSLETIFYVPKPARLNKSKTKSSTSKNYSSDNESYSTPPYNSGNDYNSPSPSPSSDFGGGSFSGGGGGSDW